MAQVPALHIVIMHLLRMFPIIVNLWWSWGELAWSLSRYTYLTAFFLTKQNKKTTLKIYFLRTLQMYIFFRSFILDFTEHRFLQGSARRKITQLSPTFSFFFWKGMKNHYMGIKICLNTNSYIVWLKMLIDSTPWIPDSDLPW